jgi:putative heme-binding domain-containing protein
MPALGSRLPDLAGLAVLRDWIRRVPELGGLVRTETNEDQVVRILESLSPGELRVQALSNAFKSTSVALAALDGARWDDGFRADAAKAGAKHSNPSVRALYQQLLRPQAMERTLGEAFDPDVVLKLKGDPKHGEIVFRSETGGNCIRCHVCDGVGGKYGPELTAIGRKYGAMALLEQIVRPSAIIAPEYTLHLCETKSGELLSGVVIRSGPEDLVLRTEAGDRVLVRAELVRDEKSAQSPMPEGLLGALTPQEAADLLAYLGRNR